MEKEQFEKSMEFAWQVKTTLDEYYRSNDEMERADILKTLYHFTEGYMTAKAELSPASE